MTDKLVSLNNIIPIGSWPYVTGNGVMTPYVLQLLLSDKSKTLTTFLYKGILIKALPELMKAMESKGARCFSKSIDLASMLYIWDHSYVDITYDKKNNAIEIAGHITDPELITFFQSVEVDFISKDKKNIVFSIVQTKSGLEIKNLGNGFSPLIEENYNLDVIEDMNYVIGAFKKKPPTGRIVILSGEPGTGKTHLIRSLLAQLECVFLIVPSNLVDSLDRPEFMPLLIKVRDEHEKPIIIIIEDGDTCLLPRKNDNISTIASLLNLSDGILGAILDIKLVISTNASIKDMDQAIMRPGRLCKQIYVGPLLYEQANKVYHRLMNDNEVSLPYEKTYTLAEIYDKFNNKDVVPVNAPTKRVIGFSHSNNDDRFVNKAGK